MKVPEKYDDKLDNYFYLVLKEVDERAPIVPGYLDEGLEICATRLLPKTATKLRELAERLACGKSDDDRPLVWNEIWASKLVKAAAFQIRAMKMEFDRTAWMNLLCRKPYSTSAYTVLARTSQDRLKFLERWWEADSERSPLELTEAIRSIWRGYENRNQFLAHLRDVGARWTMDLRMATDKALEELGLPVIFPVVKTIAAGK
jgi:hypothetical protein